MNTQQLKEYLGIVVDMEKNIFMQEHAIDQLESQSQLLGVPHHFSKPTPPVSRPGGLGPLLLVYAVFGVLAALILGWGLKRFFGTSLRGFIPGIFATCLGGVALLAVFAMAVKSIGEHSKDNENYREMMARYVEDKRRYDQDTQADKVRVENQLVEKAALEENLSVLKGQLIQSRANLEKIYSQDVIFPKYRNLVMVCSIYEYICAGRCTQLEGHEGAYNILEMEIRMDRIITQLDTIISRLSAIQQNQYVLYSAIQESNRKAESLCSAATSMAKQIEDMNAHQKLSSQQLQDQISRLQQTSVISTYQSERIQKELSYMNRMNYLAGRNDGTFFNLPPT